VIDCRVVSRSLTHNLLCGAVVLLTTVFAAEGVAQQLPSAPAPVPQLRRGADGQLEVVPAAPAPPAPVPSPPPVATAKPVVKLAEPSRPEARPTPSLPQPPRAITSIPPASPPAAAPHVEAQPASIVLPESLIIDLPRDASEVAPADSPLRELLASAKCGDLVVTNNLSHSVGPGQVEVTWTAWEGTPGTSKTAAVRTETITVRAVPATVVAALPEKAPVANAAVPEAEIAQTSAPQLSEDMEPGRKAGGTVLFTLGDLLYYVPNLIGRSRH
jgi:hypothetical protein